MAKTLREKLEPFIPEGWDYEKWRDVMKHGKTLLVDPSKTDSFEEIMEILDEEE